MGGDSGKCNGVYSRIELEAGLLSVDETLIGWDAEPLAFEALKAGAKGGWGGSRRSEYLISLLFFRAGLCVGV